MSFRRLCALRVFTSNEAALNFCEDWAIVKKRSTCACGKEMRKQRAKTVDGWRWQCSACKNTTSLRSGSFWAHSRIEMHQLLALTFFWACQLEGEMIATHTGLSERTVTSWSQRFQVLCSQAVERARRPIGGPNETVAVDESHLARRRWTGNPQARRVPALWAFGGIQLSTRELFVRVVPVETGRTRETLERLIAENIKENTTIRTDYFRSYNHLSEMGRGYKHERVNHQLHYVDPSGITTNDIESCWSSLKRYLRRRQSVPRRALQQHINVWIWLRRRPKERIVHDLLLLLADYLARHARQ